MSAVDKMEDETLQEIQITRVLPAYAPSIISCLLPTCLYPWQRCALRACAESSLHVTLHAAAAHTATDLSQSLAAQLEQQNQACSSLLPTLTPQEIWDTTSDSTSTESYCLAVAEEACTQLALLMVVDDPDAAINGVMFDRWDTHCWALHGLQGIHTGNRTQVGGAIQQRLAGIHSPVVRALIS